MKLEHEMIVRTTYNDWVFYNSTDAESIEEAELGFCDGDLNKSLVDNTEQIVTLLRHIMEKWSMYQKDTSFNNAKEIVKANPIVSIANGNIIEFFKSNEYNVILHGCNCFHVMGAGLAKELNILTQNRLLDLDRQTSYGDINKLGTTVACGITIDNINKLIFNLYTQYTFGRRDKRQVYIHWESFKKALTKVINTLSLSVDNNLDYYPNILLPEIGTTLAGGKKEDFYVSFNSVLKDDAARVHPNIHFTIVTRGK